MGGWSYEYFNWPVQLHVRMTAHNLTHVVYTIKASDVAMNGSRQTVKPTVHSEALLAAFCVVHTARLAGNSYLIKS